MLSFVEYEKKGASAWITLSRVSKHNSLPAVGWTQLREAICNSKEDDDVLVVVLTGAGGRAFSTGSDLSELVGRDAYGAYENALRLQRVCADVVTLRKPTIAMIDGFAVGGGFELALACTFRLASLSSVVGLPEVRMGTLPGAGGTQRLLARTGGGLARRMLLLGDLLPAAEALTAGLLDLAVDQSDLLGETEKLVARLVENDPRTTALILEAIRLADEVPLEGGLAGEAALFGLTISYDDFQHRITEFLNRNSEA